MKQIKHFSSLVISLLYVGLIGQEDGGWIDLFNAKNLNNWQQKGGDATYEVVDGTILGTTVANSPNSFLCTEQIYADFILEYEIHVDTGLNSGVQIRSNSFPDYRNGRVHGYQVETDPTPRAFTGGIYDESRRGWIYPVSRNPKGRTAFKDGEWNHFRVEAFGNTIRTWVNGIMSANLVDDLTAKGFIGLQVHSVVRPDMVGKIVKWRNIRIKTQGIKRDRKRVDPDVPEISFLTNKLTRVEKKNGWRLLWDGKSHKGWRGAHSPNFPKSGWKMKNGVLTILGSDGTKRSGDIMTKDQFEDFELNVDFKITKGANSGIKYYVDETSEIVLGCEYQILDDKQHEDAKRGINGNRTLGSLYDLIPAKGMTVQGRPKQFKGVGTWNRARIISKDGHVEHWMNGEKILKYDRFSATFQTMIANSKFAKWPKFGQSEKGHILLQDHGDTVHFRNIKIREL